MERALSHLKVHAWMSGLRRTQSVEREKTIGEKQDDIIKIYPILDWDDRLISIYRQMIFLITLEGMGYESIGDHHSTEKFDPSKNFKLDIVAMDVSVVCILIFPRDLTFRFKFNPIKK